MSVLFVLAPGASRMTIEDTLYPQGHPYQLNGNFQNVWTMLNQNFPHDKGGWQLTSGSFTTDAFRSRVGSTIWFYAAFCIASMDGADDDWSWLYLHDSIAGTITGRLRMVFSEAGTVSTPRIEEQQAGGTWTTVGTSSTGYTAGTALADIHYLTIEVVVASPPSASVSMWIDGTQVINAAAPTLTPVVPGGVSITTQDTGGKGGGQAPTIEYWELFGNDSDNTDGLGHNVRFAFGDTAARRQNQGVGLHAFCAVPRSNGVIQWAGSPDNAKHWRNLDDHYDRSDANPDSVSTGSNALDETFGFNAYSDPALPISVAPVSVFSRTGGTGSANHGSLIARVPTDSPSYTSLTTYYRNQPADSFMFAKCLNTRPGTSSGWTRLKFNEFLAGLRSGVSGGKSYVFYVMVLGYDLARCADATSPGSILVPNWGTRLPLLRR